MRRVGILVFMCIVAALSGTVLWEMHERKECKTFEFINRDYACGRKQYIEKGGYISLKNTLEKYIAAEQKAAGIGNVSVYFRDLRDGPVMGINETAVFAPASLMKLPLVFALYHIEEEQSGFLDTKIAYARLKNPDVPQLVQTEIPLSDLKEGELYTIEELMRNAIVYSDNDAYFTLIQYVNSLPPVPGQVLETFQELGIIDPRTPEEEVVSVRSYAALFRLLYNSSYLSIEHSEHILAWLASSAYKKGLVAGVPSTISVAHKFGERGFLNGEKLLHDCGIIYFPMNPYSLCVTVSGTSFPEMARTIAEISRMTYEEVYARRVDR